MLAFLINQPELAALADNIQGARLPAEVPHGEAQGLGDPETRLEVQGVPFLLPSLAPADRRLTSYPPEMTGRGRE